MKAILEFNLPEDNHDFRASINGSNYRSVIWDYDQWLRSEMKYSELPNEKYKAYEECRKKLREILEEENIQIEQ